jgi:hypothetical protein
LKWRQKLCPNLLIKKKIAQLINGKPGKNRYNKPQENNSKNTPPPNQQASTTYNHRRQHKGTTAQRRST